MKKEKKKLGIWGLGKVGRSAIQYFCHDYILQVMDTQELSAQDYVMLQSKKISFVKESEATKQGFLEQNDIIFSSPGINMSEQKNFQSKFLTELSVIRQRFAHPIIGITGSVGKTSVTSILSAVLRAQQQPIWTGGNIGVPMLELLQQQPRPCAAILELSSFQLEHAHHVALDLAIWTNFYPNHLDRHKHLKHYFQAKKNIIAYQTETQYALLPFTLHHKIIQDKTIKSCISYFSVQKPSTSSCAMMTKKEQLFYLHNNVVIKYFYNNGWQNKIICDATPLTAITFAQNALIVYSALEIMQATELLPNISFNLNNVKIDQELHHRLEKIATIKGVTFYNDSKSTTPASTFAAVEKLSEKPILLLLGGLSKGVDRAPLIKQIKKHVLSIYCFGAEAKKLAQGCETEQVRNQSFETLDEAVTKSFDEAKPGYQILLSPSGSSFDLFKNYEHRGDHFKKLVGLLQEK